jgi:hypothetical protein
MAKSGWMWQSGRLLALALGLSLAAPRLMAADDDKPAPKPAEPAKKPASPPGAIADDAAIIATINEAIREGWKANSIKPSGMATDYEFVRRASLDILGRIATQKEVYEFESMSGSSQAKRAQYIEKLLTNPEYIKNWANIWTTWLLTRSGNELYHEQMHVWFEQQLADNKSFKETVTDLLTATGKTNDNGAVNFLLAHLGESVPAGKRQEEGQFEMVPITSRTIRLFLGIQIQCTQCHDHPFNPQWKQKDFWGINAFFRQLEAPKGTPMVNNRMRGMAPQLELKDNEGLNSNSIVYYEQRNGMLKTQKPTFLDNTRLDKASQGGTRRQELARFITNNENFPKALVNRYWGHFMGRGFTNPVDDFGEHNPVSHPELLETLGKKFAHYNFNPKQLIRWICNSEAYGLSSVSNKTNEKQDAEPFFARMQLKAMSPEQLFESLMNATRTVKLPDEARKKLREQWMKSLVVNFGDDEGNEVTFNGTVVQALMMMNGNDINGAIANKEIGTVAAALKTKDPALYLFRCSLNRPPSGNERALIANHMKKAHDKDPADFYRDLFWALLNSNEFMLNH